MRCHRDNPNSDCRSGIVATSDCDGGIGEHDSVIIVEAAALGCALLTSSDAELAGVDQEKLRVELSRFDLTAPVIATPREIVKKFFR